MTVPPPEIAAVQEALDTLDGIQNGSFERLDLTSARDALAVLERVTAERDEALGLLDNERLYTAEHRGYALLAKDDLAAAEAERDRRDKRDDWLRTQLDGAIEAAEAVAFACGLATARAVVGNLKDARAALVGGTDAAPPEQKP